MPLSYARERGWKAGLASRNRRQSRCRFGPTPEPAVAHRRSCRRMSALPPPHRSALEACRSQLHVRAHALRQPLFRHFLGPPVCRPIFEAFRRGCGLRPLPLATAIRQEAIRTKSSCFGEAEADFVRQLRGWDSNPRSQAHEACEDSRSSTALGTSSLAGRSRTCDLRCPKPAGWPSSPTTSRKERNPRRDSDPPL